MSKVSSTRHSGQGIATTDFLKAIIRGLALFKAMTTLLKIHISASFFDFGDKDTAMYNFGVLLDPLSDEAPRISTILEVGSCSNVWDH